MRYELVAGLETHIELGTQSKLFCGCSTAFGAEPNTLCCPVCVGHPGTLPVVNKQAVYYGIMAGLALNCRINNLSLMERKNYSYPDLPKAYQITQLQKPLCEQGYLELSSGKRVRISRIQIEEDAGKLIHQDDAVYIDYNRCGVPLIEIVSEPDISCVEEAREYVEKLRRLMRYIGISDCKMQEGSMRCDVNVSVREEGSASLGTRTEIKNMNSISAIAKAMEYEYNRQSKAVSEGRKIVCETLKFDEAKGVTLSMRSKEEAHDYRFLPEPDIASLYVTDEEIAQLSSCMPQLPAQKHRRYTEEFGLSSAEAEQLTKYRNISEYFDAVAEKSNNPKLAAKFITGQIFALFATESEKENFEIKTSAEDLAELIKLVDKGSIGKNLAKVTLDKMLQSGKGVSEFIREEDVRALSAEELEGFCRNAIFDNPTAAADYKKGKDKAVMALLGAVMRESRGKADPTLAKNLLLKLLSDN